MIEGSSRRRRAAVLGYGDEGRAHAKRLRDAGWDVTVAVRPGGMSWVHAMREGFRPAAPADAVRGAEVVAVLVPDDEQPALCSIELRPRLEPGALLVFTRATAVSSGAIAMGQDGDIVLVTLRGATCRVAVEVDATGDAAARAVEYARTVHGDFARTLEASTFDDEARADLVAETGREGGVAAFCARLEKAKVDAGYEPDESRLRYYDRLQALARDSDSYVPARSRGAA